MKSKNLAVPILLSVLAFTIPVFAASSHIVTQTIPPVITSSSTAIAGCSILTTFPGSAIDGSSGFIRASCPNNVPAMIFGVATETPTFALATGFVQLSLIFYGYACTFNFLPSYAGRLIGMNLTNSGPITFTQFSNSTTQLLASGYNYCLYYQNPPLTGIQSFTIAWSP